MPAVLSMMVMPMMMLLISSRRISIALLRRQIALLLVQLLFFMLLVLVFQHVGADCTSDASKDCSKHAAAYFMAKEAAACAADERRAEATLAFGPSNAWRALVGRIAGAVVGILGGGRVGRCGAVGDLLGWVLPLLLWRVALLRILALWGVLVLLVLWRVTLAISRLLWRRLAILRCWCAVWTLLRWRIIVALWVLTTIAASTVVIFVRHVDVN
jgi:hypothetical protein